jgi:hypothetical protein
VKVEGLCLPLSLESVPEEVSRMLLETNRTSHNVAYVGYSTVPLVLQYCFLLDQLPGVDAKHLCRQYCGSLALLRTQLNAMIAQRDNSSTRQ